MTRPASIPPVYLTQGVSFFQRYRLSDNAGPMDLTGWIGTASLSKRAFENSRWRCRYCRRKR